MRSGCITCKKRHIRCDEAKPECNNCLKSQKECEGYVVKLRKRPLGPALLSWDSNQIGIGHGHGNGASPTIQLQLDPDSLDFRDAAGKLYFQEFISLVKGTWTTAASNGDLWEVTLPQLTRNNSTLRHAAIAIGALSTWHRQSTCESLSVVSVPALPTAEGDAHYFHAVAYYCRSLKLQSQGASVQDAVFLSVLLIIFETLRGNKKAALNHVNHGLAMLLTLLTDVNADRHIADLGPNPKPLLGAVADIFTQLALQSRTILHGRVGDGPPLPSLAKSLRDRKQTMESFVNLLSRSPHSSATIDRIPAVFDSLDEYEEYWLAFQRSQIEIDSVFVDTMQNSIVFGLKDQDAINAFVLNLLSNPRIVEFCDKSRKTLRALDAAFLPLFNKIIMSDVESPAYLKSIHLRLQFLGSYFFDQSPEYLNVEVLESRTPCFREFLSLAEIALRTAKRNIKNPAHQLSLQCGLAWRLLIVAFFCRDPLARDEAVWMLKDYPGQDGLWNTRSLHALALRNHLVEQKNVEGTPGEQWQRLWRREFIFEDGGDRIIFRYQDKDEITGEWQLVEDAAEIRGDSEEFHWQRQPLTGSDGLLMLYIYASEWRLHEN